MSTPLMAVDTGGTFTDLILVHEGRWTFLKLPSTPEDPAEAVLEGLRRLLPPAPTEGGPSAWLIHGSTVATNALLERRGARIFLITNAGFEDILEIGRQNRPQLYALSGDRRPPLVRREDRIGITGRQGPGGEVIEPLDSVELAGLPERLAEAEAVAVVLLHAYAGPAHEEAVGRALADLSVPVSLSSRILPEYREFERTATTVANAYVAPRMDRYLGRLEREAAVSRIRIMGSDGGALPLPRARREPVHTVLSGPAGGLVAALEWGRRLGQDRILSLDMGGTSTDVALLPGELVHTREGSVGDVPISVSLLDLHTVGAGGGSIARIDPGGALRVGPESAGAVPGPVAYGLGGDRITVTDANLWLGRLTADGLLGGGRPLDRDALREPFAALARDASTDPDTLAEGILEVANTAMEGALRVISVERGIDPEGHALVAFGGAAGLHAASLAERLRLGEVIVPPEPGLLSAFGMLVAPVVRERSRTVLLSTADAGTPARIEDHLDALEAEAREAMIEEGAAPETLRVQRLVDARYRLQSHELRVRAPDWVEAFHEAHERRFGFRRDGIPVEAVTLRVQAVSPGPDLALPEPPLRPAPPRATRVFWKGAWIPAERRDRPAIPFEEALSGPLLVTEYSATTWCPPGWTLRRDARGPLRLRPA